MKVIFKRTISVVCVIAILASMMLATTAATGTTVTVGTQSVQQGTGNAEIEIPLTLSGNTGLAGIQIKVDYDNALTLTNISSGTALSSLTFTPGGDLSANPINLVWAGRDDDSTNGVLATLKFSVPISSVDDYEISVSYNNGDIYDNDLNDIDVAIVNGKISVTERPKQNFTGITFFNKTFTYDGTEKKIEVAGKPSNASVVYTNNTGTDADEYNATATISADGYNDLVLNAKLTINPKNLTISGLAAKNKVYDGTTAATLAGGTLSGKVGNDEVSAVMPTSGTFANKNVGNNIAVSIGTIELSGADKDNYALTQPTGLKANITQAPISVKADDKTIVKGSVVPALTYTITNGSLFGGDTFIGSPVTTANGNTLGSFPITKGTLTAGSNYNLSFTNGTLSVVDKTPQNITVETIGEKTYGDTSFAISVTPDSTANLTAFEYESSNTDVAEIAADGTITIKAAGETDITVREPGNAEYAPFEHSQKLIVNKKGVTVTSVDLDAKTAVVEGVLISDTAVELDFDKLNIEITGEVSATTSNVTVSNFALKGEKSENYIVSTENLEAVITTENIVNITATSDNGTVTGAGGYIKGSSVTVTATANSGYRFAGWYIGETSVSSNVSYTFTVDADTALTAKFTRISTGGGGGGVSTYTIKFETNGGSEVKKQSVKKNGVATKPEAPQKDGYTFAGWYTDKELTAEYDFSAKVTKSITLYAKWAEIDVTKNQIILTIGDKNAKVFGENKTNDVAPKLVNSRTMLPSRFVAESLGATVLWTESEPDKVVITKGDTEIIIYIGSDKAFVNDKEVILDSPAFIENDRTYTPIRFISEELGADVEWLPDTQQVIITKK